MVLGNHDFDDGLVALAKKIDRTNAPILAANLVNRREDSPLEGKVQPYIIREIDGVKIGIIGMVTPDALQMLHDKKELEMIDITPPEVALDKYLPEMKAKGVNTVVMLSHLGIDPDLDIARAYEGRVNIIVGGHSHTRLKKPQFVGSTVVVQAGCFGMGLGKLKLAYNPGTGNVRCVDYRLTEIRPDRLEPDPKVESLIAGYEEELGPDMNVIIGKIDRDLVQKDFHVFREESNIGDMMTDIIRETTGADIGFLTASSMRSNLFRGTLRARDIYSVFPWQNNLSTIRLKGKYIPRLLEQGLTDVANGIAVSGIKVEIDTSRPPGHRILSVTDNDGKPLKPDRYYTIATRDFLAEGNLGLDAMGKGKQKQDLGDIRSMVIEGIKKLKVLSAVMDGRLINRAK
jgi:2',3'-cyclic-nucleotide 2'-phosphodiesterase (5'-nucleotidase family)